MRQIAYLSLRAGRAVTGKIAYLGGSSLPPETERLRAEVKEFLADRLGSRSTANRARSWSGFDAEFSKDLAARGWIGLGLPTIYGGAGLDVFARFVVVEELLAAGAPVAAHWIGDRQSGPLLLNFGTEEQRRYYLPAICRGESFFCIGMSEPNSGSDLASVQTHAVREDGGWRLNGTKIWTTYAHKSHYMIALVRTSGGRDDRQKGLSQFIIDLSLPGIEIAPIPDLTGDTHFNQVFFSDVLLPSDALVGVEGQGWAQVNAELAFERSGPERIYSSIVLLDRWIEHLREVGASDNSLEVVGNLVARLAVLRAMSIGVTARLAAGESPLTEAAVIKDLGTEFEQEIPVVIADQLSAGLGEGLPADLMETLAFVTQVSPSYSLRGGTREILRGMIARDLGLR